MNHTEIRDKFFAFFEKNGHYRVLSAPLVPAQDQTLLFTNAGMNQFKSVFLKKEQRDYQRAVSIQKCMRVSGKHNDFDEVGKTAYHHTFFEMLGNFSFGDYFKELAVSLAWELLTQDFAFKPDQLLITIFEDDDEAEQIWRERIGIPAEKIVRLGEKENFWQMGETGPCGPCSEIHFDRGEKFGPPDIENNPQRFIEIWNLVFMQFDKDASGNLNPLPAPSIDTGMGLERLTTLLQGVDSNYQTDLFKPVIEFTASLAGIDPDDEGKRVDFNVIADHIRALTFLISDGVLPANEGRGYVLRRILRRAAKHGKNLGFSDTFLHRISQSVVQIMKSVYPELEFNQPFVAEVIRSEEERFQRTLLNGLNRFDELLEETVNKGASTIAGSDIFKLSDTYGFPLDFAVDLSRERGLEVDIAGFNLELQKQKDRSRVGLSKPGKSTKSLPGIAGHTSQFNGYDRIEGEATVKAIYFQEKSVQILEENQSGILVFDHTPLYPESGGQTADTGKGSSESAFFDINDTQYAAQEGDRAILHFASIKRGRLTLGDAVRLTADRRRREQITIHHSVTHLLHAALREILGPHVKQAGSYVGPDKLRFDFTHFKALLPAEIKDIEILTNDKIREDLLVQSRNLQYEEAISEGAIAIFEEKYSDHVRMVSMGEWSKELCGGTHLSATGKIGVFKISHESSISSGIRRIEALAGPRAFEYISEQFDILNQLQKRLNQKSEDLLETFVRMGQQLKSMEKELKRSRQSTGDQKTAGTQWEKHLLREIHYVIESIQDLDRKQLGQKADEIRKSGVGIVVLHSNGKEKSAIVVSVDQSLTKQIGANIIIKEIAAKIAVSGGGRPEFAQAGGEIIESEDEFRHQVHRILDKLIP